MFVKPPHPARSLPSHGFSLIELLVVIALIATLASSAGPAFQWMSGAGSMNKAINDLDQALELARTYAMANHTYVRVVFSEVPALLPERPQPALLVLALYPSGGTLDTANSTPQSMADPAQWLPLNRALLLPNLVRNDALNARSPDTAADLLPSQSDIPAFTRPALHLTPAPTFTSCIQISPAGEAQIANGTPARYIKVGIDRPAPQGGKNPAILRLCGLSGRIDVLRKEDGIR